jgi:hypothetical protein
MPGMRKWVVAGVALAVIGMGTYLVSQPREGTVAYHIRELRKVGNGPVDNWFIPHSPQRIVDMWEERGLKKVQFHMDALIRSGYLERRLFTVSNGNPLEIPDTLWTAAPQYPSLTWGFGVFASTRTR